MYEGKAYSKDCSGMTETQTPMGLKTAGEPNLRTHIDQIANTLGETSKILSDVIDKMYVPRPQDEACSQNIPCDGTLESQILHLRLIVEVVRRRAIEVDSRI